MSQTALEIRKITKFFGDTEVLFGIDLKAEQGDFLVLVGPSGCGKSTLLNIIAGLEEETSGDIFIEGRNVSDLAPKDRDIAMVFQSYALYPTMSVAGNITYGMKVRGMGKAERHEALMRVAKQLQIEQLLDRKPSQLSGGQRQRVAMGRALVREPKIFLFDEPLSNLDAKLRVEMRAEIKRLHQRLGATIVYVTHDQTEAMSLATNVAVLNDGHIAQTGNPQELYDHPNSVFVANFIGSPSMNMLCGQLAKGENGWQFIAGNIVFDVEHYEFAAPPVAGRNVTLGIRPEYISDYQRSRGNHIRQFKVTPQLIETNGFDQHVTFEFCDREIEGRFSPQQRLKLGEAFTADFDLSAISLFDSKTGDRL